MRKQFAMLVNKKPSITTSIVIQTSGFIYKVYQSLVTAQINHMNRNWYTLSKRCTNFKLQSDNVPQGSVLISIDL